MRTRCKFRVVGVENVEHLIYEKVWESDVAPEVFESLQGSGWEETRNGKKERYKSVATGKHAQNIRLAAQYDATIPEDQRFMESTPSGEVKFYVSNPAVIGGFQVGKNYYVDLTPCE